MWDLILAELSVDPSVRETLHRKLQVTEKLNSIEFALLDSRQGSERVTATISGVIERFDVLADTQLPDESVTDTEDVAVYDASSTHPISQHLWRQGSYPPAARTGTPSLFDDELYDDRLSI